MPTKDSPKIDEKWFSATDEEMRELIRGCFPQNADEPAEPKCAECGHDAEFHSDRPFMNEAFVQYCSVWVEEINDQCKCPGYRPAEPDARCITDTIEGRALSMAFRPVKTKGEVADLLVEFAVKEIARLKTPSTVPPTTEPDATARARAWLEANTPLRWVDEPDPECPDEPLEAFNRRPQIYAERMAAFLESETPRIKADAVREFENRTYDLWKEMGHDRDEFIEAFAETVKEMTEVD